MQKYCQNLTVIELANSLAGPAAGMFFAELGARVIKIENPATGGDITRRWKIPEEGDEVIYSAYYCSVNWGKEILMKDLTDEKDRQEILALIGSADIVISNYKQRSARKLGMDYRSLSQVNPGLIYGWVTGYGPEDRRAAFDVVLQAESGIMSMNGEASGNPLRMPLAMVDILASHQLREGILLALLNRQNSGKGTLVQTSLYESALSCLTNQASAWLMRGHLPKRRGSQHPSIAPYGDIYEGKDGKLLVLAVATTRQFGQLCQLVGMEKLMDDEKFNSNAARVKNRAALNQLLQAEFSKKNRAAWMDLFKQQGIPAGSILSLEEVFEEEKAKAMVLEEQMPDGSPSKRVRMVTFREGSDRF